MKKLYNLNEIMEVSYIAYTKAIKKLKEYHSLNDTSDEAIVNYFMTQDILVDDKGNVYKGIWKWKSLRLYTKEKKLTIDFIKGGVRS